MLNAQLAVSDAIRQAQGDAMEALGFGPSECKHDVVSSGPGWRLRAYGGGEGRPLLIVPAPIKRPYVWDLTPAVSVVRRLLGERRRVRMLEWTPPATRAERPDLDAHIDAIGASAALIAQEPGGGAPILIGHSFGGTLATAFAATAPHGASSLVLLSAPICFGERVCPFRDALIALAPANPWERGEPVAGSMLTLASVLASPRTFVWSKSADLLASLADPRGLEIHLRVTRWALDEVPLPAGLASQILSWLYCEDRFYRGTLGVKGGIVGPGDLSTPTLAVVVAADEIAPLGAVKPFLDAAPAESRLIESPRETGVGWDHLALLVGREAHRRVWPEIIAWVNARG